MDAHHIHASVLTSGRNFSSAHVRIEPSADHNAALGQAYDLLKGRFGSYLSTLQIEKKCPGDEEAEEIDILAAEEP